MKVISKSILNISQNKPVSFEVFGDDYKSMMEQALKINSLGKKYFC